MRLGPIVMDRLIQHSRNLYAFPLRQRMLHCRIQKRLMRIETDTVNVEMVTDDEGCIPAQYQDCTMTKLHNIKITQYQDLSYPHEIQGLCARMQQRYGNSHTAHFMAYKGNS